ncbi:23S ribosomal RNA methyltransferase Erm [Glycomyces mayteni]|uniref:23S ribosomal RNA methyltransferase Erm n=1 Tax=Glycomyces mayteni TaxID=543887 RepID=A0ABW2D2A7_9ACTN|nr:23S rRNA (adenine(2058)-N(6))-methyltransferase Erm(O) [Glycomyces mayteni]
MSRSRTPRSSFSRASDRKRLSQNFLADPQLARRLAADVGPDDLVVEVGPGGGMLTAPLLDRARRVLAYEKDRHFAERLQSRYGHLGHFRLRTGDFRDAEPPREPFRVVANVPFAITTDIVRWCLDAPALTTASLVVQREFARKHTGDYGRWSKLAVDAWPEHELALGLRIGREQFRPVPNVDAAVLHLTRRPRPLLPRRALRDYRDMVALGFTGVGGSLASSLRQAVSARAAARACAEAGIAKDAPVGLVHPDKWIALYKALTR